MWNRWDTQHYLAIADVGYAPEGSDGRRIVFYPLYPWLVRLFATGVGNLFVSALLVSGLASLALAVLLHRLVRLDRSDNVAWLAVFFLFVFPTSYFLHIGYTESLFLLWVVGAFLAARRHQWMVAGVLAGLASLTRLNGILLIPCLLLEALEQYRTERKLRPAHLWILLGAGGFGGYLLLNQVTLGNPFAFLDLQRLHWFKSMTPPWVGLAAAWRSFSGLGPSEGQMVGFYEIAFSILGLLATIFSWLRLRSSYAVWMTLNWLLITSTGFLLSVPRYTIVMFPLFILLGDVAEKSRVIRALIAVLSTILLTVFVSRFVQGAWAF